MFIHDFVHVEQPLSLVLDEFARSVDPWLGTLVSSAWLSESQPGTCCAVRPRWTGPA